MRKKLSKPQAKTRGKATAQTPAPAPKAPENDYSKGPMAKLVRKRRFTVTHYPTPKYNNGPGKVVIRDRPNGEGGAEITYGPGGMVPTYQHAKDMVLRIMHDLKIYAKDMFYYELTAHGNWHGEMYLVRPSAAFRRMAYDDMRPENQVTLTKKTRIIKMKPGKKAFRA